MPTDATDVRKFKGAIGITRSWVKNLAEIMKPLTTLTGKAFYTWGSREQAEFQMLKDRGAQEEEIHEWDFLKPVKLHSDASMYGAECVINEERAREDRKMIVKCDK